MLQSAPLRESTARAAGFTLLELLVSLAVSLSMITIAVPLTADTLDSQKTMAAGRYLWGRINDTRMEAVKRSAPVALRFEATAGDYRFGEYLDGNGNGVRAVEITAGIDRELEARRTLADQFSGIRFGLQAGLPDLDGQRVADASEGVRIGSNEILTLGPDGTATSGTLYIHGRRAQIAVRILGATGRVRLFRFDPGTEQWIPR
jgi:prepilin-type N-terminal cleavage/methylation domain-containing protein